MKELCDLKVQINGEHNFFISQNVLCSFSGKLRKILKEENIIINTKGTVIRFMDFPGSIEGFELISRFCYNNGRIDINPSNICFLHCGAIFLEMEEEITPCNLLKQTENFLDGILYLTWHDLLISLKSCESFFAMADSSGLLQKLLSSLIYKISVNSDLSSPSSSSSPEVSLFRCSFSKRSIEAIKPCLSREWWFRDLLVFAPKTIEKMAKALGAYGCNNKSLILTKFLLNYLKSADQRGHGNKWDHGGLADTAVYGVLMIGRNVFNYRGLFWVLRLVSRLGLSKECREKLERLIGSMLDKAELDDLLVSGHDEGVYDVKLVMRLVRFFVIEEQDGGSLMRMKKVGRLMDKYLREISPDQRLKASKFLGVAESLPDSARDCYDGVYRALEIFIQTHPNLSFEDRKRLCRCLNHEKLTLETCKDLAKNPRIPPDVAVQALASQQPKLQAETNMVNDLNKGNSKAVLYITEASCEEFITRFL
ncbi:hypothetical protein IEQ34_010023 [Dendrobium chrysotoxum]|uniref:Phototropic-responsive NPH3 family protein n=1 Tax=Dendrobium chrysotoxum TaxID=161865 RepID=A0AAV7H367_DENCH|nr:hypothetical protein IEQ34_010023 [Dendrobium chrysotoxum]